MLKFSESRTPRPGVEPICPVTISADKIVLIAGILHLAFGVLVVFLQVLGKQYDRT